MDELDQLLKKLGLSVARGVPQLATGFIDLLGLPLTLTGMQRPEDIVGSTAYLTERGFLPPPQTGLLNETAELISSAVSPAGLAKTAAGLAAAGVIPVVKKQIDNIPVASAMTTEKAAGIAPVKKKKLTKEQIDPLGYGKKGLLTEPLSELDIEYVDRGLLAPEIKLTMEDLQGSVLFPLLGDHSKAGSDLVGIGGNKFKTAVPLEGGFNFMRSNPSEGAVWASGESITSRIHNDVSRIAEETGLPVNMIYSAMGKDSIDFATFPALTLTEMLPFSKIKKKDLSEFHKKMKSDIEIGGEGYKGIKDFPKLDDKGLRAYLETAKGETRKKFVRLMDTDKFQRAGFPSVAQARYATTEDVLKDVSAGESGFAVGRLDTSKPPTSNPLTPHSTYPSQISGEYLGGLKQSLPRDVIFRDFYKRLENAKTKAGKPQTMSNKDYIFRMNLPYQIVDQELVDTIMNFNKLR